MSDHTRKAFMAQTPDSRLNTAHKRIIVCCDGTWQNGLNSTQTWKYSNILRIARAVNHLDHRYDPPIHQVVFYQSGIGTDNIYDSVVDGVTGATLANKVEEAYGFIAHNYHPGDEIYLFGFSRGAYTARMVAMFIGAIGVLDRTQMDNFATIFLAYQKRGKAEDEDEIRQLDEQLAPWRAPDAPGEVRTNPDAGGFTVKVVGVFDTVGSLGLPEELTLRSEKLRTIFGFPDRLLGHHVERAYHAMAINETRKDFDCAKFEQTDEGRKKGQILKQCWFSGCHCDVGGGYEQHDLSDIAMNWMIGNIEDALSFDYDYLTSLPKPEARWGSQSIHNAREGVFVLANEFTRTLPTETNEVTHEMIHASVLQQPHLSPALIEAVKKNAGLIHALLPWEEEMKAIWEKKLRTDTLVPTVNAVTTLSAARGGVDPATRQTPGRAHEAFKVFEHWGRRHAEADGQDGHTMHVKTWLGRMVAGSSISAVVQEFTQ